MGALIDASVLIAAERGQLDLEGLLADHGDEDFALSAITASELLHGVHRADTDARRGRREAYVEALLARIPVIPFDLGAARMHARLAARAATAGVVLGAHDLIIAATALAKDLDVVTRDEKSFPRIAEFEPDSLVADGRRSMTTLDLEARIGRLEDLEAIRQLKARYCLLCDGGYDADGLADLFTEDAVWDGGALGKAQGREGIRRFFQRTPQVISFAVHMVMNPLIAVDGDAATGTWYLFQASSYVPENAALWGSARYDEEYVRVGGAWKFSRLRLTSFFWTPFDQGWMRTPSVFDRAPGGS